MVRNDATFQARSMPPRMNRPTPPARSRSAWMIMPTVAVSSAQGTRPGIRWVARPMALPTVGSPPLMRSWAPATRAPVKNTLTTVAASEPSTNRISDRAGRACSSPAAAEPALSSGSARTPGMTKMASTSAAPRKLRTGRTTSSRSFWSTPQEVLASSMVFRMRPMACRVVADVRSAAGYREKSMRPRMISPSWSAR